MRHAILVVSVMSMIALPVEAQRFRRPYSGDYALGYGYDHDGGGSGCRDFVCDGRCYNGHSGNDFRTPLGTTVVAAAAGRVVQTNDGCADYGYLGNTCGGGCGNMVRIEHSNGSRSLYCHMRRGTIRVSVGQTVTCGQTLGQSASSGNSTGPHLHFGYYSSSSASSSDPFSGSCSRSTSLWTDQNGYSAPGTGCSCTPSTETCNGRDDDCDGQVDDGVTRSCSTECGSGTQRCSAGSWGACSAPAPTADVCNGADDDCDGTADDSDVCEIDLLHLSQATYAAPTSTDVNGDGRADLCARGYGGVRCWIAGDGGYTELAAPVPWGDESGWTHVSYYSTIRMGDLDGDGRADLCARASTGVTCMLSSGDAFAASSAGSLWRDTLSNTNGWNHPRFYTTLRLADVDADGREDLCARDSQGFGCWLSDGTRFDRRIEGPRWSDESGWGAARYYGTIRMRDIDGDRRADVCARSSAGVECWLSDGNGFPTRVEGPAWSDESGWGAMQYWSTLRLADVNGDERADLCARSSTDLSCVLSNGAGFDAPIVVGPLSDEVGWDDAAHYATLRAGDMNGDGAEDLCIRAAVGMRCYMLQGDAFARIDGPVWSDESGWGAPRFYHTIRMADFDGDGLDDLCARASSGWRCQGSLGETFTDPVVLDELTDAGGWDEPHYFTTILSAGRACRAEMEVCNGRDDDCDGMVDEDAHDEMCNERDDDCDGEVDEHAGEETCNGADDDCDGETDEDDVCAEIPTYGDGGVALGDAGMPSSTPTGGLRSDCGCRGAGAGGGSSIAWLAPLAIVWLVRRRRSSP
jgi:MYXO-CTERM domain-containing protein